MIGIWSTRPDQRSFIPPRPRQPFRSQSVLLLIETNYLKIAFRNFRRHKAFASINIVGLAVGLTLRITLLTVGHKSIRPAAHDPAECLRYG